MHILTFVGAILFGKIRYRVTPFKINKEA